jgi:SpoVK/Ycf46/Vps4 family AAA+-type ATPase
MIALDSLSSKPVDGESRMDMVDISYPSIDAKYLVLNQETEVEIQDFIDCYRNRDKLIKAGIDETCTLLLYGPPGCGKTTVAQAISMQTGLPLITARLDGLISSLLGSTAKNIRKIFDFASRQECILFLDEFDVIAKVRDDKNETGELKRVVNSLIQNIDIFSRDSIIIAATNHHELLDPAIWRRFNRVLVLEKPSVEDIQKMLALYVGKGNVKFDVNPKKIGIISNALLGLSHADIKTIINNAIKTNLINSNKSVSVYEILRESYFFRYHSMNDEDEYVKFLITHGMTHKELQNLGFSLRKVQLISKMVRGTDDSERTTSN